MAKTICYLAASARDWGGASRVLFTTVRLIDRERYTPLVLLPYPGPIMEELDRLGIRYRIWGKAHEPRGAMSYAAAAWKALRMFRQEQVDLFHMGGHYWRPAEFEAAKLLRIPTLMHYHYVVRESSPAARRADGIIAVSGFVAEHSQPESSTKYVVHNAVELSMFEHAGDVRAELGIPQDAVVVTFVGQIRVIKGIDMFLQMARSIKDEDVRFLIVGGCRDPKKFKGAYTEEQLSAEMAGDDRCIYAGYRSDVQNIYASSDVVVVPSRWDEPFGLINIEAGAAGKPVVATRVGGMPEISEHGVNGFLIDPDDVNGLCDHVSRLINSEELRLDIGRRARAIVEERFSRRPVETLERVYERLT